MQGCTVGIWYYIGTAIVLGIIAFFGVEAHKNRVMLKCSTLLREKGYPEAYIEESMNRAKQSRQDAQDELLRCAGLPSYSANGDQK